MHELCPCLDFSPHHYVRFPEDGVVRCEFCYHPKEVSE